MKDYYSDMMMEMFCIPKSITLMPQVSSTVWSNPLS